MTDPRRPSINLFGIDATDVTVEKVLELIGAPARAVLEKRALEAARTLVPIAVTAVQGLTPDLVDPFVAQLGKRIEVVFAEEIQKRIAKEPK